MSLTDLKHIRERTTEAGRMVDLVDRRLSRLLLKLNSTEHKKYGSEINEMINLLQQAEAKLR